MITIRNNKLFNELKEAYNKNENLWYVLFDEECNLKDQRIPYFVGALDHIEVEHKGIYFFDRGCNGLDNSFVIRPEL